MIGLPLEQVVIVHIRVLANGGASEVGQRTNALFHSHDGASVPRVNMAVSRIVLGFYAAMNTGIGSGNELFAHACSMCQWMIASAQPVLFLL